MSVARWYPTATQLADGRVFVFAGDTINASGPAVPHAFKSSSVNSLPEVYNPTTNTWQALTDARLTSPLYPLLFTLTDGRIVNVGPDTVTRTITPGTWIVEHRRDELVRRRQRGHVPARQDHEVGQLRRPRLRRRRPLPDVASRRRCST